MAVKPEVAPADALSAIIQSRKIVDLSVIVDQFYPAFQPESQEFLMVPTHVPGPGPLGYRGPMYETIMVHDDHTGTHCDAPAHQVPPIESGLPNAGPMATVTVEQLEPRHMMGPACVIDCTDLLVEVDRSVPRSPLITREKVEAWEKQHGSPVSEHNVVLTTTRRRMAGPSSSWWSAGSSWSVSTRSASACSRMTTSPISRRGTRA